MNNNKFELIEKINEMGHEQVIFCNDKSTGLKAIIAIHNTVLGPALGGTRMWTYNTDYEAIIDVLRLSKGMTYKASISGLNLGGGKAVIIGNSRTLKNEALMRRFGKFVNSLSGKYITAEDVGMTTKDMEYIHNETNHVVGIPQSLGGSGDPSPVTAYGVYMGIKASLKQAFGNDSLKNKKILVEGIGNVGSSLIKYLVKEEAKIFVFDVFEDKIRAICEQYNNITAVNNDDVFNLDINIYAPCALGATINDNSLKTLKCEIIAGAANNQLENENKHADELKKRGIIYAPDFLINAGGLINCYSELEGYNEKRTFEKTQNIYDTTLNIYKLANKKNINTHKAAKEIAKKRIQDIGNIKIGF